MALSQNLQVQCEHQCRAVGGLGAVNQALNKIAVAHHIQLKPKRVVVGGAGHVFNRANAHGGQGKRHPKGLGRTGGQHFTVGMLHACEARGRNGHRHGDLLAHHGGAGAAVVHIDGHALAQLDALKVAFVGAVSAFGP